MKVGIVGLGLIGGSLGLDLRVQGLEILGVSRQEKTCAIALDIGVADKASTNLSLLKEAEIIFICTPIKAIASTIQQLTPHLPPETILTDVGSVKAKVVAECSQLWHNFLGGHPMAGKAEQGIEAAEKNLFINTAYVLTPTPNTPKEILNKVAEIAQSLGANLSICSPETHDQAVAWISHAPVMISASLIHACMQEREKTVLELAQKLASSGFRDTSRVGGGNWELGVMMAQYNKEELLKSLLQYRQSLETIINTIQQEDWQNLEQILKSTNQERSQFLD
ncbi:MAG: prephenate/arogenate dehydrogenase [Gomphosphaeria aponina SAG 52.96 = DSM 107014]|uniref:Prephenate/arogenate dehydrogenase n=1 Tax=Gomphosphaeria aponina SAG 52.96 = DSM 107014 TaxID=1521640 RepID=A0A941GMF7_9CHRO|nr:prephenate/arogenate dehydrogenase [Gomphosphaeria aponina SAG 52.96 = DSM 107014]